MDTKMQKKVNIHFHYLISAQCENSILHTKDRESAILTRVHKCLSKWKTKMAKTCIETSFFPPWCVYYFSSDLRVLSINFSLIWNCLVLSFLTQYIIDCNRLFPSIVNIYRIMFVFIITVVHIFTCSFTSIRRIKHMWYYAAKPHTFTNCKWHWFRYFQIIFA